MSDDFWKVVRELAAMREHIPEERRQLSGMYELIQRERDAFEDMHAEAIRAVACPICGAASGRECAWSDYPNTPRVRTYVNRAHVSRLRLAGFVKDDEA